MKIINLLIAVFLLNVVDAQPILLEDFESVTHPSLPATWSTTSLAIDGGFYTGNSDSARVGSFWLVKDHTTFAMTNDDGCGTCDKSEDYLVMPVIDLSGYVDSTVFLQFDAWMEDFWEGIGSIKVDTGLGWMDIYTMVPTPDWQTRVVDLSSFTGSANVTIAFHYNDEGTSTLGLAIDNVIVFVPDNQYDAAIYSASNTYSDYVQVPQSQLVPITLSSTVYNNGQDTLYDVKVIAQSFQTGFLDTALVGTLSPAEYASIDFSDNWVVSGQGVNSIDYWVIHSNPDNFTGNDLLSNTLLVSDSVLAKEAGAIADAQIPLNGEVIAQTFRVYNLDTITSISFNLLLADPGDTLQFYIYDMAGGFPDAIVDSSQVFTNLSAGWSTHYLLSEIELDTGYYAIGMKKIGTGITGLSATEDYYTPNTTFTSRFFIIDFFWYWDEQAYPGTMADHHTYLMRPNFGGNGTITSSQNEIVKANNLLEVYPNPSEGRVSILSDDPIEQVNVYDVSGKLVFSTKNLQNKQLDVSFLEKGVYFGKIKATNKWKTIKMIIK